MIPPPIPNFQLSQQNGSTNCTTNTSQGYNIGQQQIPNLGPQDLSLIRQNESGMTAQQNGYSNFGSCAIPSMSPLNGSQIQNQGIVQLSNNLNSSLANLEVSPNQSYLQQENNVIYPTPPADPSGQQEEPKTYPFPPQKLLQTNEQSPKTASSTILPPGLPMTEISKISSPSNFGSPAIHQSGIVSQMGMPHPGISTLTGLSPQTTISHPGIPQNAMPHPEIPTQNAMSHSGMSPQTTMFHPEIPTQNAMSHPVIPPQNAMLHPGMSPQNMMPHSGMPPQTTLSHPEIPTQNAMYHPAIPPQNAMLHPGMSPQNMMPHSGMPPQTTISHPGIPPQNVMSYKGMPPQTTLSHSGMISTGIPKPGIPSHPGSMPSSGIPYPAMPSHPPSGMSQPGIPPHPGSMLSGMPPHPSSRMSQPGIPPHPGSMPSGMPPSGISQPGIPPYPGSMPSGMPHSGMSQPGIPPHPGSMLSGMPPHPSSGMSQPGIPPHPGSMPSGMPPNPPSGMSYPGMAPPGAMDAPTMQHKQKLDPNMMPSAVQVMEDDKTAKTGLFQTGFPYTEIPPLVSTDYYCQDQGNCNPKFMRSTLYCAPANQDMLKNSAIPFGMVISPLAKMHSNEATLPIIDLGELGPVRCQRCKAYMCPYMEFQDGGRRFKCPLCLASSDVPEAYFAHLDHTGRRADIHLRPEQFLGSYEFIATKPYCKNGVAPKEPAFVFVLDVSYNAFHSGMVSLFCQNIRRLLDDLPIDTGIDRSSMRVGFITYDQTVHFYNLQSALEQPQMMVVSDVEDIFVPLGDGFLVSLDQADNAIVNLLTEIPKMFAETRITETILGPAIQGGLDALKASDRSGKLFVFHSSLPIFDAPGKLKNRDDRKLLGTDKEKTILTPQNDWYSNLASECVQNGCCVDLFLFPNAFIDVATIGTLCSVTGGDIYRYQFFDAAKDGARFLADLHHDVRRPVIFDVMIRVRTSTGLRPTSFLGSMYMQNTTDMELGALDCDKALNVEMKHDDRLDGQSAFVQTATLFTSCNGQRRLRVHNMQLLVSDDYNKLYRMSDQDTVVNFLLKQAEQMLLEKSPKEVRDQLTARCAQILATYRERCSEQAPLGQLILPECLKLLPLYVNCLVKNDILAGGSEMTVDERAWLMRTSRCLRVEQSVPLLYPRLLPLSTTTTDFNEDMLPISTPLRASVDNLHQNGVYLLENGLVLFLWIGQACDKTWIRDVFGVDNAANIDTEKHDLPEKDNHTSRTIRKMIEYFHINRPRRMKTSNELSRMPVKCMDKLTNVSTNRHRVRCNSDNFHDITLKLFVIRQQDSLEPWMKKFLVEDRSVGSNASYVEFLCYIHREIRSLLS